MNAYLCLGSNLGDRESLISNASQRIAVLPQTRLLRASRVMETEPYGVVDQPHFLNQVLEIETALSPHDLLRELLAIEDSLGRVRTRPWGARLIDIDILLMGDLEIEDELLSLPHPDFHNRVFALDLLCELAPDLLHPKLGSSIKELLGELQDRDV